MKIDRAIAVSALVLAVPGFVLVLFGKTWSVGALCLLLGAALGVIYWYRERPHFTIKSVEKELHFHDEPCCHAKLVRRVIAVANHPGITEFWCRNIGADGQIDNILIDGERPDDQRKMGGDLEVCKRFDRPLKRGKEFSTELSYDLIDSFNNQRESLIHIVEGETKRLYMKVAFPKGKRIDEYRSLLKYGGEERSEPGEVRYAQDRLEIEIKRPKLGAQYCIEWTW